MMKAEDLKGKTIVITGASSGFGKGAALSLAQHGTNLVLAARRDYLLEELAKSCENLGASALPIPCDVSVESDVELLAQSALDAFGRIDVWINDAGVGAVGVFTDIPLSDHEQVIKTDLLGTIYGSYFALKQFRKQNAGTLINISSILGKVPAPYYATYTAAKHGVVGFCASLRQELREQKLENIQVCTIMPMAMDTPFFEHAANYSGHKAVAIPPVDDAQKVIDAIVDAVLDPKDEIPVGKGSATSIASHNVAPGVTENMMGKNTHKTQMEEAPPAPPHSGSLSQPDPSGTGIHGTP